MTGVNLTEASLTAADLTGAELGGVKLRSADLSDTLFEPKSFPDLVDIARAYGLEQMTYKENPTFLVQLRKMFQDAGFREQERAVTCALNRAYAARGRFVERWFKTIAFDLTSQYGLSPFRALRIILYIWLLCTVIYAWFIYRGGRSGIYLVSTRQWRGKDTRAVRIQPHAAWIARRSRHGSFWQMNRVKWRRTIYPWRARTRPLRVAMFFSLMSAFNIPFRDVNFGLWLRMLTRHRYDLQPSAGARTVSGIQSLLSVYLIALWLLTYFGRPFG